MNVMRRLMLGVVVCVLLLAGPMARAQALRHLPADALVVIKVNKPQEVNRKLAAMFARLGVDKMNPALADPLTALKDALGVKEGFDGNGEIAIGIYKPAEGGGDPLVVAVLPVTDYGAFLKNMGEAKKDGELDAFKFQGDNTDFFSANYEKYAVITPSKELLAKKPEGITVQGLAGKQLDANDVVAWANGPALARLALPALKEARPQIIADLERNLAGMPNPKFVPVIKALVNQGLNGAEHILNEGQGATLGVNLSDKGINTTVVAEFTADGYIGKTVAAGKNTEESLIKGLPGNRKYFAFGGVVQNSDAAGKLIDDILGPVSQELAVVGDDAKVFNALIEAVKAQMTSIEGYSLGYIKPANAQAGLMQAAATFRGDARKIAEAQKQYMQAYVDVMKLMPQNQMTIEVKPAAKTVDGVALDQMVMKMNLDPGDPAQQMAKPFIDMIYGPNGLNTYLGPVDDKTLVMSMGGDEQLLADTIAAAKAGDDPLSGLPHVAAVSAELPKSRAMVFYIALDNLIGTGLDVARNFGVPVGNIRMPENLSPIGMTIGTEASAVRMDTHIPLDLVEKLMSIGFQMMMQQQGGGGAAPGL
jgi:hypothetical protein